MWKVFFKGDSIMNKKILLMTVLLFSCAGGTSAISSSSSINSSSISSSDISSSSINSIPSIGPISSESISSSEENISSEYQYKKPSTLGEVYNVIYHNIDLEGLETKRATLIDSTISFYSNDVEKHTLTQENLTMYKDFSYSNCSTSIQWKNCDDTNPIYSSKVDNYTRYKGVQDDYFYAITDYESGKENDYAKKYLIIEEGSTGENEILRKDIPFNKSILASYYFLTYLDSYFLINLGDDYYLNCSEQEDDLKYDVEITGSSNGDEYGSYKLTYSLLFTLQKDDGFLKDFTLSIEEKTSSNELLTKIERKYMVERGNYSEENIEYENPENYFLKSFTVGFWYPDPDKLGERIYCDDVLPIHKNVYPYAKTYEPEKALDLDLTPVATSNQDVVSLTNKTYYTENKGTCQLEVASQSGIVSACEVTVGNTEITKITLTLYYGGVSYMGNIFPGDQLEILYKIYPTGTLDDIVFSTSDSNIAKVNIIKEKPYLIAVSAGEVTITAYSKYNDKIKGEINITISENNTDISVFLMAKEWHHLYADLSFYFDSSTTGYMMYNSSLHSTFNYSITGNYKFQITDLIWIDNTPVIIDCELKTDLDYFSMTVTFDDGSTYDCNLFPRNL